MTKNIDLNILQKLFFEKSYLNVVFDPHGLLKGQINANTQVYVAEQEELQQVIDSHQRREILIVNLSTESLADFSGKENIIGFFHFNNLPNGTNPRFFYINNSDKSIRWVFPQKNSTPAFLALYNSSGWKAKCYKFLLKAAYKVSAHSRLMSGSFWIESSHNRIARFFDNLQVDQYAIFTGTAGENRKAILALYENKRCSHFVKAPLTKKASILVENEKEQLTQLNQLGLSHWELPLGKSSEGHLTLTNVQPKRAMKSSNQLNQKHLKAIDECYSKTIKYRSPAQLSLWNKIGESLQFLNRIPEIENDISKDKVKVLTHHLSVLYNRCSQMEEFPVAFTHGDFTPWNMYETKDKLHVYDWEMCADDQPLLFDLFHYTFQTNILIQRNGFKEIQFELDRMKNTTLVSQMIDRYAINWSMHYAYYLLYIVSYYLPLYIQQKDLHAQAHWLIDCWVETLNKVVPIVGSSVSLNDKVSQIDKIEI